MFTIIFSPDILPFPYIISISPDPLYIFSTQGVRTTPTPCPCMDIKYLSKPLNLFGPPLVKGSFFDEFRQKKFRFILRLLKWRPDMDTKYLVWKRNFNKNYFTPKTQVISPMFRLKLDSMFFVLILCFDSMFSINYFSELLSTGP